MKNDIKVIQKEKEVDIKIIGDVKIDDIEVLTQSCKEGSCDCSPKIINSIEQIDVNGIDGNINISLKGEKLNAKEIEGCMGECECGF